MREQFEKLSHATRRLLNAHRECSEGLELPGEFLAGLIAQSASLDRLSRLVSKWTKSPLSIAEMDRICFKRLRDAYSLYPGNPFLWSHISFCCRSVSGESAKKLASCSNSNVIMLHVSCKARIDRAFASVKSFQGFMDGVRHIIVVGIEGDAPLGFRFRFDSEVLEISVPDEYESHCIKCLHAYATIALLCSPSVVIKVDDDARLADSALFNSYCKHLLSSRAQYVGSLIQGVPSFERMWHGWHIGKCGDKRVEALGYQAPIPRAYMDGGFSYAVNLDSLISIAKFYLHHRKLLAIRSIMYEDAMVGLGLELAGVSPTSVDPCSMGIASERHQMQQVLTHKMSLFNQRIGSVISSLSSDYIINNCVSDD